MPECLHPESRALDPCLDGTASRWAPTVDHIVPRSAGGSDDPANLRAAHQRCNAAAGPKIPKGTRRDNRGRSLPEFPQRDYDFVDYQ
jgi:5-methylcytosine-specific restriction endonuclease McrA